MSGMKKGRANEITSLKELEKEFANMSKLFTGKETDKNWDERDASLRRIHAVINSDNLPDWKSSILQGLHVVLPKLIQSIHSLRTVVVKEALSMIEDTSIAVGEQLDVYNLDIILTNLLKSSSVTKKFIAERTKEVTIKFLQHTAFHSKLLVTLCKTKNEKNIQLRQFASEYLCTLLSTHASKDHVKSNIEKSTELIQWIDQFLKKGLGDASLLVRNGCRKTFGVYRQYFPEHAEKLFQTLDKSIQLLLDKASNKQAPRLLSRPNSTPLIRTSSQSSLLSRTSSQSSLSSTSSTTPSPSTSKSTTAARSSSLTKPMPTLKSRIAARPAITKPLRPATSSLASSLKRPASLSSSLRPPLKRQAIIPATSIETINRMRRQSNTSAISAPPTTLDHQLQTKRDPPTRRTQSEFHQQAKQSAASLLHMLQSNDVVMRRKGIHTLADRLKKHVYHPQPNNDPLPPDVPQKMDLLPVLMANLAQNDAEMNELMQSWESIAGIFVHVMGLVYYAPVLIMAGQKGFERLKMFLKRNDPDLAYKLLEIANQLMLDDIEMLDASVKKAIRLDPSKKTKLQNGFLEWMDELVCEYLGIPKEEDAEMVLEGAAWLNVNMEQVQASEWFNEKEHIRLYIQFVLKYPILKSMAGHLKMANERIFETETNELEKDIQKETFSFDLYDSLDEEEDEDSGMTQEISNIVLKIN